MDKIEYVQVAKELLTEQFFTAEYCAVFLARCAESDIRQQQNNVNKSPSSY